MLFISCSSLKIPIDGEKKSRNTGVVDEIPCKFKAYHDLEAYHERSEVNSYVLKLFPSVTRELVEMNQAGPKDQRVKYADPTLGNFLNSAFWPK